MTLLAQRSTQKLTSQHQLHCIGCPQAFGLSVDPVPHPLHTDLGIMDPFTNQKRSYISRVVAGKVGLMGEQTGVLGGCPSAGGRCSGQGTGAKLVLR
jgi:hypothetical protein